MIIRLPKGSLPQKFSGRGLVLLPGDNEIGEPDQKLAVLLRRGEARGKWEIDPIDEQPPTGASLDTEPADPSPEFEEAPAHNAPTVKRRRRRH